MLKSPASGRAGLSQNPARSIPIRRTSGRTLSVPTNGRGRPRVPRAPRGPAKRFPTKGLSSAQRKFAEKTIRDRAGKKAAVQSVATQAGKAGALKTVAGRLLGAYGALSLVADLFELANPFVQDWLAGGWRDSPAAGLAPTPTGSPEFEGGQCTIKYTVYYDYYLGFDGPMWSRNRTNITGPILGSTERQHPSNPGSIRVGFLSGSGATFTNVGGGTKGHGIRCEITSVATTTGQADNCGSLPAPTAPNPLYDNPVPSSPPGVESPAPTPQSLPLRIPPSPYSPTSPNPVITPPVVPTTAPSTTPRAPSVFDTGTQTGDNAQATPLPGGTTQTPVTPEYSTGTSAPTKPGGGSCESAEANPCSSSIFDFLEYLDDKMDRQNREEEEEPKSPPLVQVDFPYVTCNEGESTIKSGVFLYDPTSFPGLESLLEEQANLAMQGCQNIEPILAHPEVYDVRVMKHRPKLVLIFRRENTRDYYSFTIPHPANTQPITTAPLESFQKGTYMGSARLSDNSRVVANCDTRDEAERVVNIFLSLCSSEYKDEDSFVRISERRGYPVASETLVATAAYFYEEGNRNLAPTWRRSFTGFV